jgi:hypothetical protein
MTIVERIKVLSKNYGTQKAFSTKVGMSEAALSYLLKNVDSDPKSSTITSIVMAFPSLNPKWLLLGEGKMWLSDDELNAFELGTMEKSYEALLKGNQELQKELNQAQQKIIVLLEKRNV